MTVIVGRRPLRTLARLAVLILGTWVVFTFVLTPPIKVTGISMSPTYRDGQINFLYRLAYSHHDPKRGDVVGVHMKGTDGDSLMYLKRVVALPGETISFENGRLVIDDKVMPESYEQGEYCDWNMAPVKLGFDEYFVVGDNRSMPRELHWYKKIRRQDIVGRILFKANS